jgi:3-methyladenine DNA glycosylase/8-oxoguanine DNA glycosylase
VREGVRRLDELAARPREQEVLARSEVWRPLRSVACWYLWRLAEE